MDLSRKSMEKNKINPREVGGQVLNLAHYGVLKQNTEAAFVLEKIYHSTQRTFLL
jgi:hypothetical protein